LSVAERFDRQAAVSARGDAATGTMCQDGPPREDFMDQVTLTPAERAAAGRAARRRLPLAALAAVDDGPQRPDPISLLEQQATTRVPELVPIRYGRMLASPFAFYRGAAQVSAHDVGSGPSSGLRAQLCGDAHLANFGVYGSAERRLVFDLNDFDETAPGPFEWDVLRLATSFEIAGRSRGFIDRERAEVVRVAAESYRRTMREFAGLSSLAVWYAHADMDDLMAQSDRWLDARGQRRTAANLTKARNRDNEHAFSRLVTVTDGRPTIIRDPPYVVPVEDLYADHDVTDLYRRLRELLRPYRRSLQPDRRHLAGEFELVGIAHKVVGVGSVGLRAWILLFTDDSGAPLLLQAKQAQASVLEPFAGASKAGQHGRRVVLGQRLMQASSDIFLGWTRSGQLDGEQDYYVRQLRDWKGSVDVDRMVPAGMTAYARLCGWTLARAHARSGDRMAIAGYLGGKDRFDRAVVEHAAAAATRNERDHAALATAVREGRLVAADAA
jgi:uncharacterized protein (DUF2252 family)